MAIVVQKWTNMTVSAHKCLKVEISELKLTFIINMLSMIYILKKANLMYIDISKKKKTARNFII